MAKKFLTGLNLVVLDTDPTAGSEGELYFNSSASVAKIYQAGAWSVLGAGGGGTTVSTTEPASPEIGDSWYKNDTGEFYVYDGTYWVEVNGVVSLSQEQVQDYVAPLFTHENHVNASVTYDDELNQLHIDVVSAPTAGFTSTLKHDVRLNGSIAKGQAVYVSSANGTNMVVSKASNASEATSSKTLGLLETGGSNNALVKVVTEGLLAGLDTSTANSEGDPVWLGTDGNLIYGLANKPYAPAHLVFIGVVTRKNSSNGEIFVKVQNGFELNEIHNVLISGSVQNNEILAYDLSNGVWINKTAEEAGFLTEESASTTYVTQIEANESFQPLATVLSNISDLELSSGFLVSNGVDDWYIDENEYLTIVNASSTYLSQEDAAVIYLAHSTAASAYQPIGEYLIGEDLNGYLTESSASVIYQPVGDYLIPTDLNGYLTESSASITYQPLDEDLTQIALLNSSTATAGLLATNGSGYWTIDTNAYLTTETDPVFTASDAYGIDSTDISNWDEAHGWGNHAGAGYALDSHNHTLDSLSNVVITGTPSDGQAIVWDTSTSKWVNETVSGGGASYPTQTGNDGKFLQTNGASVSWQDVDFTGYLTESSASTIYATSASPTLTGKVQINDFIKFTPTEDKPTWSEGNLYYDSEEKTLILQGSGSTFEQTFGQREWVRCRNTSGSTIYKGQPVYITGVHIPGDPTHGHHPTISLADASDVVKKEVLGLAGEDINDGSHGYVVVRGYIEGLNTSSLISGSRAHLGFEYPGQITKTAPEYPNYPMDLGICLTSASVDGTFYVNIFDHSFERIRVQYGAYIDGDLTVDGNITLNGEGSQISVTSLSLQDNWLYVGAGDSIVTNSASVSGLDDMLFKGHYEGGTNVTFYVKIDGTSNPNTFAWSYDDFATTEASGISITGNLQSLEDGISVQFEATTGHTLNDKWIGPVVVENLDFGLVGNYVDAGTYTHSGIFRDATDNTFKVFQSYNPEITGNINVGDASFAFGKLKVSSLDVTDSSTTKSNLGLGNVEDTALSTWAGSSNITTLGTVTSGVWSGTEIGTSKGGTGLTSLGTSGQVLKVNSGATALEWGTVDALPSQSGNNGKYLTTDGSTASWGTLDLSLYLTQSSASTTYLTQSSASTTYATKVSPTLTTPNIGAATGTSLNTTGNIISHIDILTPTFTTNAYTLTAGDDGDLLMLNNSSSSGSLYVPTDASVNFAIGTQITMVQSGSGQITILATTPATTAVNATPGSKLRAQWSSATLVKIAANTWVLMGDLSI